MFLSLFFLYKARHVFDGSTFAFVLAPADTARKNSISKKRILLRWSFFAYARPERIPKASRTNGKLSERLFLRPVYEIQLVGGARESRVQPSEIIGSKHIVGHVALVNIHAAPLSALRLVARYGIGIFYL